MPRHKQPALRERQDVDMVDLLDSGPRGGDPHHHDRLLRSNQFTSNNNARDASTWTFVDTLLRALDAEYAPTLPRRQLWQIFHRLTHTRSRHHVDALALAQLEPLLVGPLAHELALAKIALARQHDNNHDDKNPDTHLLDASPPKSPLDAVMGETPVLETFLTEIARFVREKNAVALNDWLRVAPPYEGEYARLIAELRATYPTGEQKLHGVCARLLHEAQQGEDGASWSAFVRFMVQYLTFLRDVDPQDVRLAADMLNDLAGKCNSALGHPTLGILLLPSTIQYSRVLADLTIRLKKERPVGHPTEGESPFERAANTIRNLAQTCLMDRSVQPATGRPEGKKAGLYKLINTCLRLMFQCGLASNTQQIFTSIQNNSLPLYIYPAADRVTYLYYLGRYHFAWNDFQAARLALQEAYRHCHARFLVQRRRILVPLIAANMILGRFPAQALLQRPEAAGLADIFGPICQAIKYGHTAEFHRRVSVMEHAPHGQWLRRQKILYQLQNRCLPIVWRSLIRRVFLLHGVVKDGESRAASTLQLQDVLACVRWLDAQDPEVQSAPVVCEDLDGAEGADRGAVASMLEVEGMVASLVHQGLLNGFIAHKTHRFAILGGRKMGAVRAGFPNYSEVVDAKVGATVPGWKREAVGYAAHAPPAGVAAAAAATSRAGPGAVVRLSGAAMQPFPAASQ